MLGRTCLLGVLMTLPLVAAGCQLPYTWPATYVHWNQRGIYEAVPPPGKHAGFTIEEMDDHGGPPEPTKIITRERRGESVRMGSDPDGNTSFSLARRNAFDDASTGRFLNSTFDALGLPEPRPPTWRFQWETGIC